MTLEDVKAFIEENAENEDVQRFVDSLADKRVNQAREKWEKELDGKVEEEIQRREQKAELEHKRLEDVKNRFKQAGLDEELGLKFMPKDVGAMSEEDLESAIGKATESAKDAQERLKEKFVAERFEGKSIPRSGDGNTVPERNEIRKAMGLE
jgi:hypothetical protein